ncbi:hypothetical protein RRG08_009339 [Elysia crispata]|uniref:Uncharacterized protein n=1 Tax=Elysia crispata TaxID=231223 RepID=A0AAE0Y5Z0_9GAST|nr:hypothetical protein RRG08_009339 [Elysia crispata]
MDPRQQLWAKKAINDILFEADAERCTNIQSKLIATLPYRKQSMQQTIKASHVSMTNFPIACGDVAIRKFKSSKDLPDARYLSGTDKRSLCEMDVRITVSFDLINGSTRPEVGACVGRGEDYHRDEKGKYRSASLKALELSTNIYMEQQKIKKKCYSNWKQN